MIKNSIITDRLVLEKLSVEGADFIKSLVNTNGWIENIGDRNIHSLNDAITYIQKILGTENLWYWVVSIKNTNGSIGIISFMKRNYLDHFDIGFAFLPDFNNRGYAYEASKAVLSMVSTLPEYNVVLATTKSSNKRSVNLLTKLGFSFEKEIEVDQIKLQVYTNAKAFNAG